MSIRLTLPHGMKLTDWADQVILDLDSYGIFGVLLHEEEWQNWGMQFVNNAALRENIPTPYSFQEWHEWAERFCQAVE